MLRATEKSCGVRTAANPLDSALKKSCPSFSEIGSAELNWGHQSLEGCKVHGRGGPETACADQPLENLALRRRKEEGEEAVQRVVHQVSVLVGNIQEREQLTSAVTALRRWERWHPDTW